MHEFNEEEFNRLISNDEKIEQMRDKLFNEEIYKQFIPNSENLEQLQKRIAALDADGGITAEKSEELQNAVTDYMNAFNEIITPEQLMAFNDSLMECYEPDNITEILAKYDPKPENDADREFVNGLKSWILSQFEKITDNDIYVMGVFYSSGYDENKNPIEELSFAYNTENYYNEHLELFDERWNLADFKEEYFDTLDDETLKKWLSANNLKFGDINDEVLDKIFGLVVVAVSELHGENAVSKHFGRKIPIIINDYDYYHMTAVRAVKANGAELFDEDFFDYCGCDFPE